MFPKVLSKTAKQSLAILGKEKFFRVAHPKDIAAMKIAALADRGTKKDFIDLYFLICKEKILTLGETLELYDKKYGVLAQNKLHIIKSLGYFDDADASEMPRMIHKVSWSAVKKFFLRTERNNEKTSLVKETILDPTSPFTASGLKLKHSIFDNT